MNAVLRVKDQQNDRAPTHCVLSGKPTEGAIRVWAVEAQHVDWIVGTLGVLGVALARLAGRKTQRIMLPIDPPLWKRWQGLAMGTLVIAGIGAGILVTGTIRGEPGKMVFGLICVVLGITLRVWFSRSYWVAIQLRPPTKDILIRRAHPDFGRDAKKLYTNALGSSPSL